MKRALLIFVLLCARLSATDFSGVGFDQHPGGALPLESAVIDEGGNTVPLSRYFHGQPVILVLAYYGCPNLCTLVLNAVADGLTDLKSTAGKDFEVVVVSIDPRETPALAAAKKAVYLRRYGRTGGDWHFLTAREDAIHRLTTVVGFRYFYDTASGQYAHPSGVVIADPRGHITQYLIGLEFPPREISLALQRAERDQTGPPAANVRLLCFHYDPRTGAYTLIISRGMQLAGFLTAGGLLGAIVLLNRKRA